MTAEDYDPSESELDDAFDEGHNDGYSGNAERAYSASTLLNREYQVGYAEGVRAYRRQWEKV